MASKKSKINVQGTEILVSSIGNQDYISLTDMVKNSEGEDHIRNWMRNKNTIEFLGVWEKIHNPLFKGVEFDTFLNEAGLNRFNMTPRKWIESTNAIGIISKSGRNGGTYAHKDIAFEFGAWISPIFKLYLITEYQRLKESESDRLGIEWDIRRIITKANYELHTGAIKEHIIPYKLSYERDEVIYANEADMLNLAVFGCTAKQWRDNHFDLVSKGKNIRDEADINELTVLSNIESLNSRLIKEGISKEKRFDILKETAKEQLERLNKVDISKRIKKISYIQSSQEEVLGTFDKSLTQALNYNPHTDPKNHNEDDF